MTKYSLILFIAVFQSAALSAAETRHLDGELALTHDDNVNRGAGSQNERSDNILSAGINLSQSFRLGESSGLLLRAGGRHSEYARYHDLSNLVLTAEAIYRAQPVPGYSTPVFDIALGVDQLIYRDSDIRDGQIARLDAGLSSRLTDRIRVRAGAGLDKRWAKDGDVYDMSHRKLNLRLDYRLPSNSTITMGFSRIFGDQVFTAMPGPGLGPGPSYINSANAIDQDPVFGTSNAYRFDAISNHVSLGFNLPINSDNSLDISAELAEIDADGGNNYRNKQLRFSWLHRFW